jgi:hypothetical protein
VPPIDECLYFLPIFREKDEDNHVQHLIKFHQYMNQLDIHHEDVLMKMLCTLSKVMQDNGTDLYLLEVYLL